MRFDLISAVPEILESPINYSIIKRAREKGIVEIHLHNLHDYGIGRYRQIDDKPYGGGSGMVLMPEPIYKCVKKLQAERDYDEIIVTSAKGEIFTQKEAKRLSLLKNVIIICGHYKGIDQRVIDLFNAKEISIGKFVLSGGELPALVIVDAVVRLLPGALGDSESALTDSFIDDDYVEPPIYTRPQDFLGLKVPEVLVSGDHNKIREWKEKYSTKID
ncbi:MAG: tRNA (guanosine(37)-N1)-methyltransferase TrmD [Ignavibacteria bacterium]|nr:tRNA (guanosine(37)-N1)-methyltransferase TrmD [Ignavibacteria bacterium]MDH7526772.1 tRNA (guanosine(37)-N1)-methyltransferase TrmD [Ignavibacteria bacterium]